MKAIVAILSAALIAVGGSAIHLWRQLDVSRQQIANLKEQVDTTAASAHQATTIAPTPAMAPLSSLPLAEPAAAAPTTGPVPGIDPKLLAEMERLQAVTQATRSPEAKAKLKASAVANMSTKYVDVGKVLGLSRSEVDQLFDLLYEQSERRIEKDPNGRDAALQARLRQTESDEIASLLGSKYAKWEEYKTEVPTRQHVKNLNAALDAAGTPLGDAQNNSLIKALVAEEKRNSQMPIDREFPAEYYRFTPEANRNLLSAATAYLTPQQMESYSQVLERASNQETVVRNRMIRAKKNVEALRASGYKLPD